MDYHMFLCAECGLAYPTMTNTGLCVQCGTKIISYLDAINNIGLVCGSKPGAHGICPSNDIENHILGWRNRCYQAELWLSRLLGLDLNQVVRESERRREHPLGLDEEWEGTHAEWIEANLRILRGAIARLTSTMEHLKAGNDCNCADCRGVIIDIDRDIPDIDGAERR